MKYFAEYHHAGDIVNGLEVRYDGWCFMYQVDEEYPMDILSWGYEDQKKCFDDGVEALKILGY